MAKIRLEQCIPNLGFPFPFNTETVRGSNLLYLDMANPMPVVQYGYVTQGVYYPIPLLKKVKSFEAEIQSKITLGPFAFVKALMKYLF